MRDIHDLWLLAQDAWFGWLALKQVSKALEETELHLMLCLAASERGRALFQSLLGTRAVDGVMLTALRGDDPLVRIVAQAGLPTVYGGRPLHGEPAWYVDVDNWGGARTATDHLIGIGRMHIANNDLCNKLRRGQYRELALFNKSIHLKEAMEAVEPGFVEESRKSDAAD